MLVRLVQPPGVFRRQIHGSARIVLARVREPGHGESREARDLVRRQRLDPHHERDERRKHVPRLHVVLFAHRDE